MTDLRVQSLVGVADPERPGFVLKPNADGSINIQGNVTVEVGNVTIGGVFIEDEATGFTAKVSAGGLLSVDASSTTVPISAVALPLPTGASTAANQATEIAALGNIATAIAAQAKLSDTQPVSLAALPNGNTTLLAGSNVIGHVIVDSGSISGAVTVTSGNIAVSNFPASQAVTVTSGNVAISNSPAVTITSGNLAISNFPATQPVSGAISFTAPQHVILDSGSVTATVASTTISSGNVAISNTPAVTLASTTISSGNIAISNTPAVTLASTTISSGNIAISNSPAVTVTSGNITATVASTTITGSVAVTGTFWQTTQPVSDANLELAQGASGASTVGPMVQGLVNDVEPSYLNNVVQPISLTNIGRLRVAIDEAEVEFFPAILPEFAASPDWLTASPWGD